MWLIYITIAALFSILVVGVGAEYYDFDEE